MAIEAFREEIFRFLKSDQPEILEINGEFGVGKTFAWKQYYEKAKENGNISLPRYSYVSLFDIGLIKDLKFDILLNSKATTAHDTECNSRNTQTSLEQLSKKAQPALKQLGKIKGLWGAGDIITSLAADFIKDTIICIDDIERHSPNLSMSEILGTASNLRDQHRCKVILIQNKDQHSKKDRKLYKSHHEKTVDIHLTLKPTPRECSELALPEDDELAERVRAYVQLLGIDNIRAIRKIMRYSQILHKQLESFDKTISQQALKTAALLEWSRLSVSRDSVPDFEYIMKISEYSSLLPNKEKDDRWKQNKVAWDYYLRQYEYGYTGELDRVIGEGLELGYFEHAPVIDAAERLQLSVDNSLARKPFEDAIALFHGSFHDNEQDVVTAFASAIRDDFENTHAAELNVAVILLRKIGREDEADSLIEFYVCNKDGDAASFDTSKVIFSGQPIDSKLQKAFQDRFRELNPPTTKVPKDELIRIGDTGSTTLDDITYLNSLTVEDYVLAFRQSAGEEKDFVVQGALLACIADSHRNNQENLDTICDQAFRQIANESPLNRFRLEKYNIRPEDGKEQDNSQS